MYTLSAVSELIGYSLCHFNDKLGRKLAFVGYLGLAGLMCLGVSLLQLWMGSETKSNHNLLNEPLLILVMVATFAGKAMTSAAFNSAYIYTSHMYPTKVRNTMLMFVSSIGRIGSLISPQVNLLGDMFLRQLPYLIFSVCSLVGCVFIAILPDPFKIDSL